MIEKHLSTGWLKHHKDDLYKFEEVELEGERIFQFHILDKAGKTSFTLAFREDVLMSVLHSLGDPEEIGSQETWIALVNLNANTPIISRLLKLKNAAIEAVKKQNLTVADLGEAVNVLKKGGNLEALANKIKERDKKNNES